MSSPKVTELAARMFAALATEQLIETGGLTKDARIMFKEHARNCFVAAEDFYQYAADRLEAPRVEER
jgi:hypothetical protein